MTRWPSPSRKPTDAAWNCTRGSIPTARGYARRQIAQLPRSHISKTHPQLVRHVRQIPLARPGRERSAGLLAQCGDGRGKRYDVDGIHFDDYFYPYDEQDPLGKGFRFPDDASWQRFGAGGKLSRDDWRRENVNVFIQRVYKSIKAAKPWVKFGVSPFGIWRPEPATDQGL